MKKLNLKIIIYLLVLFLFSPGAYSDERQIQVEVDERIELVTIMQYIGGYRYPGNQNFPYKKEVERYFEPYKNLEPIKRVSELMKKSIPRDTAIAIPLYLSPLPELKVIIPFPDDLLARAGGEKNVTTLVEAMQSFVKSSNFSFFLKQHRDYYQTIENQTKAKLKAKESLERLEAYYGIKQNSYHIVLASLIQCGGFGPRVKSKDNALNIYSIIGPCGVENDVPDFGGTELFEELIYHEFSHSFINPLTSANLEAINKYSSLMVPIAKEMNNLRYGLWEICLNEHLVRTFTSRLAFMDKTEAMAQEIVGMEVQRGFVYLPYFLELFKEYEQSRDQYKNMAQFYPRIIKQLENLSRAPFIPTNLRVSSVSKYGVEIEWKDNASDEKGFLVYRSTKYDSGYEKIDSIAKNSTNYSDTRIEPGENYWYKISAYHEDGEVITHPVDVWVPWFAPENPKEFRVVEVIAQTAELSWEYEDKCAGFILYKLPEKTEVSKLSSDKRSVLLRELPFGLNSYQLFAFNEKDDVVKLSSKGPILEFEVLLPPENLIATAIDLHTIELEWVLKEDFSDKLTILRKTGQEPFSIIKEMDRNTKFQDTRLSPNTEYHYMVFSGKGALIKSDNSNIAKAKTFKPDPVVISTTMKFQIGSLAYWVNDKILTMDVAPLLRDGRTFLPIRYVADALDATIDWSALEQKITIQLDTIKVELWIGQNKARINEKEVLIDVNNPNIKPFIENGRTFLPLRFVGESLGCSVNWDSKQQVATLIHEKTIEYSSSGINGFFSDAQCSDVDSC